MRLYEHYLYNTPNPKELLAPSGEEAGEVTTQIRLKYASYVFAMKCVRVIMFHAWMLPNSAILTLYAIVCGT